MRRVVIESPYAGDVEANVAYAHRCLADCLARGEAPLASHLLYTQPCVLDDEIPDERAKGIAAGLEWHGVADAVVFYTDHGFSRGMKAAEEFAKARNVLIEYRSLNSAAGEV